jgi:hypothetical protein
MENQCQSATVPKAAFFFCRYSMAVLAWLAWACELKPLLIFIFVILVLSALLTIRRAPLVLLYTHTLHRLFPSPLEELSVSSMRFAHTLGSIFAGVCLLLIYTDAWVGWRFTLLFCIMKTISALGLCPAYKLHRCMTSGSCCAFLKQR